MWSNIGPPVCTERCWLAFVVDEPADEVPWMSRPVRLEALACQSCVSTSFPLSWVWRPASWPVWNHRISRAVCFWSSTTGTDRAVFDELTVGRADELPSVEPVDREQLHDQLIIEREVGRRHLAVTVEGFYDRQWRREHSSDGRPFVVGHRRLC